MLMYWTDFDPEWITMFVNRKLSTVFLHKRGGNRNYVVSKVLWISVVSIFISPNFEDENAEFDRVNTT